MSRKGKTQDATNGRGIDKPKYDGNRLKWVDGYLNEKDKQWLSTHSDQMGDHIIELIRELASGYKLSCKFESSSGKYQASLIPDDIDCINSGYALSHRASDPTVAIFVLSYKHFIKFDGRWGEATGDSDADSLWD